MTSKRVYKDSMSIEYTIQEFIKNKGSQFDPRLTETFLDILKNNMDFIKKIQEN